jgi:hypothetical protein
MSGFLDPQNLVCNLVFDGADPCSFIPTTELSKSPQKNLARAHPMIDFLQVCVVQFFALMLSITERTTRLGSLMMSSLSEMAAIAA